MIQRVFSSIKSITSITRYQQSYESIFFYLIKREYLPNSKAIILQKIVQKLGINKQIFLNDQRKKILPQINS